MRHLYKYITKDDFNKIVRSCKTKKEMYPLLGLSDKSGYAQRKLKELISYFDADISHFTLDKISKVVKKCRHCGSEFKTFNDRHPKSKNCCSRLCANKFALNDKERYKKVSLSHKRAYKNNPDKFFNISAWVKNNAKKRKVIRVKFKCECCKADTELPEKLFGKTMFNTCSKECNEILLSKHRSERLKNEYANGRDVKGGKTKWITINTTIGEIKVQGSYEFRVVKILEKWKFVGKIRGWEYSKDRIPYNWEDGSEHIYIPDFKIFYYDGSVCYIEVKGRIREHCLEKVEAVRKIGMNIELWKLPRIKAEERNLCKYI